jgi:ligand-binding SRPBCC domain-containing protein
MSVHILRASQVVPISLATCWDFFSDPRNLEKLTPPTLDVRVHGELPPRVYAGLMIQYRVRPLFHLPVTWLTEITRVEAPHFFVDEQRVGPYALWHHEHFFKALDERRTEIRDLVHYVLPFGWLGDCAHGFLVQPQLERIFAFRKKAVKEIFGEAPEGR